MTSHNLPPAGPPRDFQVGTASYPATHHTLIHPRPMPGCLWCPPTACRWCGAADCDQLYDHDDLYRGSETTWRETWR